MHDLNKRGTTTTPQRILKGIAFEIADLALIKNWADTRNIRMVVSLDHGTMGEEYEEVIAFYPEASSISPLIMWRTEKYVFVQPLNGCTRRYSTVTKALDGPAMARMPSTILTDIVVPATISGFPPSVWK
jgi:hypothetical protein